MGKETRQPIHVIAKRFYNAQQSWWCEHIVEIHGHRYRVVIRRNSHDEQSYLHGYVFGQTSFTWNLLVDRPIQGANCQSVSYVDRNPSQTLFAQDTESVLTELRQIVTGDQL
jgi:hypothetical protein